MKSMTTTFVKGILGTDDILYNGNFQVAFMGRSNVGKSSLINSLVGKPNLAWSSSHPGKTIRMDFFLINNSFYFVDFPGYGYAKRGANKREKIAKMILWYILYSEVKDRIVVLVLDAKVGVTEFDADMIRTFREKDVPCIVVANKIDNVPMGQKDKMIAHIADQVDSKNVIAYSSKKNIGRTELLTSIQSFMPVR